MELVQRNALNDNPAIIYLIGCDTDFSKVDLPDSQSSYLKNIRSKIEEPGAIRFCQFNNYPDWSVFVFTDPAKKDNEKLESYRLNGVEIQKWANLNKIEELAVINLTNSRDCLLKTIEGLALSNYQFLPYFSEVEKKKNSLQKVSVECDDKTSLDELKVMIEAVYRSRDLVNEPLSSLNAPKFAKVIMKMGNKVGIDVEIMDKAKIEALKMGGLLAVNRGSIDPPRFCVLDYKPEKPVNEKPLVLVGKGVMYDTGGLSLKPTPASMDHMKCDMAGSAAVLGSIYAIAAMNWPVHVVALIPATDNRPDGNAYVPGDVVEMHNGLFVEVLNTDAEGRMILADALSYAKKYDPDLVIDMATLTGAAAVALGNIGTAVMGTADKKIFDNVQKAGNSCNERTVEFPMWADYGKLLDSEIADLKNIGGRDGGAITAGKFLERFTDYPWIHMDIAGPAFLFAKDGYRTSGGTGTGVRLLTEFVRKQYLTN